MRVLIVEDDLAARKMLRFLLEEVGGYEVVEAASGRQGRELASQCDLVITDLAMPQGDGFSLCKTLRARSAIPILAVSASRTAVTDRVRALRSGADDYLAKPFDPVELLARVEALGRRTRAIPRIEEVGVLRANGIVLDLVRQVVSVGNEPPVPLTPAECRLLARLAQTPGQAVSRQSLQEALWGSGGRETEASLASYILALRRKIEPDPRHPRLLVTVRGVGYRLL